MNRLCLILFGAALSLNVIALKAEASWLGFLSQEFNLCVWDCDRAELKPGVTPAQRASDATNHVENLSPFSLSPEQSVAIEHLAMPQSLDAIADRFGAPGGMDASSDFYRLADGGQARVFVRGATAYRIEIRRGDSLHRISKILH